MKQAAVKVLDENWLPSHSQRYREAYHPAYRVLHKDYRKPFTPVSKKTVLEDLKASSEEFDRGEGMDAREA